MKYPVLLFLGLASTGLGHVVERAACNADNCARAVTGTAGSNPNQSSRLADCSSFMRVTVTPATS